MTQASIDSTVKGLAESLRHKGFTGDVEALLQGLKDLPELKELTDHQLHSAILSAASDVHAQVKHPENGTTVLHPKFEAIPTERITHHAGIITQPESAEQVAAAASRTEALRAKARAHGATASTPSAKKGNWLERLDDVKLNKGLAVIGAGLLTFGALESSSHIVGKDERGESRINMSPLLWTLGYGLLAAGTAYVAFRQPQAASAIVR